MTPLRAILLTAVSSPQQATSDKESLETQERDLRALAAREGWEIVDVLRIPGHSRRYFNYHEFAEDMRAAGFDAADKMFSHWKARDFDVLAVWMGDRLSREQSMFAEIIARTIDAHATIYDLKSGGWIKEDNYRMYAAMSGYAAASAIDALVTRGQATKDAMVDRGIIPAGRLPFTHRWLRDENGKKVGVELDEKWRAMTQELAFVLLEGVSWRLIPDVLAQRGYARPGGLPYSMASLYKLLHNPIVWGHVVRGFGNREKGYTFSDGAWAYDKSVAPPEYVRINYDCHAPLYEGRLAEQVRAELNRRHDMRGRMSPSRSYEFSGLFICAECGSALIVQRNMSGWLGLRCRAAKYGQCSNRRVMSFTNARKQVTKILRGLLNAKTPALPNTTASSTKSQRAGLRRAIDKHRARIDNLIDSEANVDIEDRGFYRDKVKEERVAMRQAEQRLHELERAAAVEERSSRALAAELDELRAIRLENFWAQEPRAINQRLRAIIGDMRFAALGNKIVGSAPKKRA